MSDTTPQHTYERRDLAELHNWTGADAQVNAYSAPHARLCVRFYFVPQARKKDGELYLLCSGCLWVRMRPVWQLSEMRVDPLADESDVAFVVSHGDDLVVRCRSVELLWTRGFLSLGDLVAG